MSQSKQPPDGFLYSQVWQEWGWGWVLVECGPGSLSQDLQAGVWDALFLDTDAPQPAAESPGSALESRMQGSPEGGSGGLHRLEDDPSLCLHLRPAHWEHPSPSSQDAWSPHPMQSNLMPAQPLLDTWEVNCSCRLPHCLCQKHPCTSLA